ncbi:beta-glucosidase [Prauserella marina]|uniref:beta-N-acetylhexosaminidase n=1 Tax=Prauserella marina TaxID=530584 RepID=A0A222VYG1_9PSEU|nr:glycoside hydrolase family 3 N-terminal domain-containing protein [Prauserella marina]ASR38852.1 beta-glucosidase [Prauserella marina]PWV82414.1 beta-N-acetylhexosaminidase [Prauserella marina]SDC68583.1 beta-N-acetylhexosaminidase [Prauserella marina]
MKRLLMAAAMVGLVATGCSSTGSGEDPPPQEPPEQSGSVGSSAAPEESTQPPRGPDCTSTVDGMSPRERVAQLVVVGVDASDPAGAVSLVGNEQVGGIFIGGNATALLSDNVLAGVHDAARVPVSVAIDDEGGRVQRIDELDGDLPSARDMAATMTPDEVRDVAEERGKAMAARGVTVDYAPDVDLTDEPAGMAIGDRSFSADPDVAREYAQAFAEGLAAAGIEPVLKHFPGHGNASGDSHTGAVTTPNLPQLREHDLKPYENIEEYGDVGVMVGHLTVPDLTGDEPASIAAPAYELLRDDYGFSGPVVTDDLGAMRAITDRYSLPDAVLKALQAGADQALWSSGGQVGPVLDRLESAVATGELSQQRVSESLDRVLRAKNACG